MISDSACGGTQFVRRKGQEVRQLAGKKRKRFTTIGLTGLDGKPAMCIVIFTGVERNLHMESGIDSLQLSQDDNDHDVDVSVDDDAPNPNQEEDGLSYFCSQYGEGNLFPGGPECDFNNKKIPTMIR